MFMFLQIIIASKLFQIAPEQNLAGYSDVEENSKSPETKANQNCFQFPFLDNGDVMSACRKIISLDGFYMFLSLQIIII